MLPYPRPRTDSLSVSEAPVPSLHVIGSRSLGGAEKFYVRLISGLHEAEQPVTAVNPPGSGVSIALAATIPQVSLAMRNVFDPIARWRLGRLIHRLQPAIVQTYLGRATRLTHVRPGRGVVHVARLGGYYNTKGYRHAHAWIGNTRGICEYLVGEGFPAERVFHIGNFVDLAPETDPAEVQRLRDSLGIGPDTMVLLALGRLHETKDFSTLLEAFAQLTAQQSSVPMHLIIVGDGPLRQQLHDQAARLGVYGRVHWPGWRDQPRGYFALADVLVCPSRREALGNVILEAWAHDTPVISTRTHGAEELIADGENGLLVPCEDPGALAAKIGKFLHMPEHQRTRLAANGRATLEREHSKHAVVHRYLEVYRQLVSAAS